MSAKSAYGKKRIKNPYGNPSKRGRGNFLLLTVIVLVMAAGTWITTYTAKVGSGEIDPNNPVEATNVGAPAATNGAPLQPDSSKN